MPEFPEADLRAALASASSWRGVLRNLGLPESSSARLRAVQRAVRDLGLDAGHLRSNRTWSDASLVEAVAAARSWPEVRTSLGLSERGNGSLAAVRRHAARLGIDTGHLDREQPPPGEPWSSGPRPEHLRRAGPMLAAAWFTLCGYEVLWPLEPCRYDLAAAREGRCHRVQVKTTTHRAGGTAVVTLSTAGRRGRITYDTTEIDQFFVVDDELNCYLIPTPRVAGRYHIRLQRYEAYRVVSAGRLLPPRADPAA
jgi:hypothetical protein